MILLQSLDSYNKMLLMSEDGTSKNFVSKSSAPPHADDKVQGHFGTVDGETVCLFKIRGQLQILIGARLFGISDGIFAHIADQNDRRVFTLLNGGNKLFEVEYHYKKISPPLDIDIVSSFVEEEQFDILLFANNVINDLSRRARIYR